jgi:hypothetical protein
VWPARKLRRRIPHAASAKMAAGKAEKQPVE